MADSGKVDKYGDTITGRLFYWFENCTYENE